MQQYRIMIRNAGGETDAVLERDLATDREAEEWQTEHWNQVRLDGERWCSQLYRAEGTQPLQSIGVDIVGCMDAARAIMPDWRNYAVRIVHAHDQQLCFEAEVEGRRFSVQITEA